jgi:Toprim-like/CHC2 zinc finger
VPRSLSDNVAKLERAQKTRRKRNRVTWLKDVNAVDLLENFDVANISQATPDEVLFSCPFSGHTHGDERPSAYMNNGSRNPEQTTLWKCHGCGRSGNAIGFVAEHENVSRQQAMRWLKEHYAPGYRAPRYGSIAKEFEERRKIQPPEVTTVAPLDNEAFKRFDVDWGTHAEEYRDSPDVSYMLDRGFTPAMLEEWGIGYDSSSRRITIPVCDPDRRIVGFKGRAWEPEVRPKYLILGDKRRLRGYGFTPYDKSKVVFGLDMWGEVERYVMVEGEIDVMSLWVMNIPAICTGGSNMSLIQSRLIRQYCDEVVLFFDDDTAGRNFLNGIDKQDGEHHPGAIEMLEPFIRTRVVGKHRYDPNDYLCRGERERVRHLIDGAKPPWRSVV